MTHNPADCQDRYCKEFACKLHAWRSGDGVGFQVSPSMLPNRRNHKPPRLTTGGGNAWERGVARDSRGMPLLKGLTPIGVKEYSQRRREIDDNRRKAANAKGDSA